MNLPSEHKTEFFNLYFAIEEKIKNLDHPEDGIKYSEIDDSNKKLVFYFKDEKGTYKYSYSICLTFNLFSQGKQQ